MSGMSDEANLAIAAVIVLAIGYLIFQIDRRVRQEGTLFKRDASPKSRIYSFIIGVFIGVFVLLEWIVGIRVYLLLIVSIALIGYGLGLEQILELLQPKKTTLTINEIEGTDWQTKAELDMQIQAGGKFVVFEYCLSFLFITSKRRSKIYFIKAGENHFEKSVGYNLISILLGWLNPMKLSQVLKTNMAGGRDITQEIMALFEESGSVSKIV